MKDQQSECYFSQSRCQRNSPPSSNIKTGRDTVMIPLLTHIHSAHHYHTPKTTQQQEQNSYLSPTHPQRRRESLWDIKNKYKIFYLTCM